MKLKPLCIYHGGCDDGMGAALVLYLLHKEDMEYFGATDRNRLPDIDIVDRDVIMVDFSYKRELTKTLLKHVSHLTIIDHHKTAEADLIGLDLEYPDKLTLVFDMNHSGAALAWMHYFKGSALPPFLQYIEDRDMWWKKLPYCDEFTFGLRSYPQDLKIWETLSKEHTSKLIEEGMSIHRFFRTLVDFHKEKAVVCELGGYRVPVVNAPHYVASEVAGEISIGYPFGVVYSIDEGGFRYSLRSKDDGADVSEVAKKFGGGGHTHAAGFGTPEAVHK